jgi:branched-chain amino acid transport system substrate-binding protein
VLKYAAAGAITTGLSGCAGVTGGSGGGSDGGPIKIGDLSPRTGTAALYGIPKRRAAQLAVQQQNEDGGLLGREIELLDPDPQTDNQRYKTLTQELILEDEVDMLAGTVLGSEREAIRPIIAQNKQLLFVSSQYSGGLCDQYVFNTGADPTQQMNPLIPYMIENFGSDVYIVAADYNFGRNSAARAETYVDREDGTIVGEEFIPLSVSDFTSTINNISSADPDWIMHLLVGDNHVNFFKQIEATGSEAPIGSTLALAEAYEHKSLEPPVMSDVYSCMAYFQEVPSDRNREFVRQMQANEDVQYVNQTSNFHYQAYQYYFEAVEAAGTTDQQAVCEALETGDITVQAPEGEIRMTGAHSSTHNMRLGRATSSHDIEFVDSWNDVEPTWLQERCTLGPSDESTWDDPRTEWIRD